MPDGKKKSLLYLQLAPSMKFTTYCCYSEVKFLPSVGEAARAIDYIFLANEAEREAPKLAPNTVDTVDRSLALRLKADPHARP